MARNPRECGDGGHRNCDFSRKPSDNFKAAKAALAGRLARLLVAVGREVAGLDLFLFFFVQKLLDPLALGVGLRLAEHLPIVFDVLAPDKAFHDAPPDSSRPLDIMVRH